MENLIITSDGGKTITTSLLVATTFGKNHKEVLRDLESLNCSNEFNQRNFALISYTDSMNRKQKAYEITKDGFSFLVMGYKGPKAGKFKEDYINAFNLAAEQAQSKNKVPENYGEALIEAGRLALANQQLQIDNNRMKPRDEFVTKVFETTDLVDIGEVAKILNLAYGRNTLFAVLREKGILFKSKNEPYQQFVSKGYFTLKPYLVEKTEPPKVVTQTYATQKGLGFIAKILGVVHIPENKLNLV
jgi:anti-repressor protein